MSESATHILVINAGSTSVKFAVFDTTSMSRVVHGKIDRIGMEGTFSEVSTLENPEPTRTDITSYDSETSLTSLLKETLRDLTISAIGHRVVHGGVKYYGTTKLIPQIVEELKSCIPFAPRHVPAQLQLINALAQTYADVPQFACFDTGFHHDLPQLAQAIAIPQKYRDAGVRRYGFHGLSYEFLMHELEHTLHEPVASQRIILAHLGSGASLAAVKYEKPWETTMSFTPNSGIPMSTRSGDIDPGVIEYLLNQDGMTHEKLNHMLNYESGILAVSGYTSDMEVLLKDQETNSRAREAVELFCYNIQKQIGALAASMGGVDLIAFSGGIGERSAEIRARICKNLDFLGIKINPRTNETHSPCISDTDSEVILYTIPTDEEITIVRNITRVITRS